MNQGLLRQPFLVSRFQSFEFQVKVRPHRFRRMTVSRLGSCRIRNEIRQVLLNGWDPIRVSDVPECSDECDCCLGDVYELLTSGSSDDRHSDLSLQAGERAHGPKHAKRIYDVDGDCASAFSIL